MKIALVRHGEAPFHIIDTQRQLSKEGQFEALQTALYLKEIGFDPHRIIHSGLDRARDTAEIIRKELNCMSPCEVSTDLTPESDPDVWEYHLQQWTNQQENLILVSHMPLLPLLLAQLSGKRAGFPTAGCVILEKQLDKQGDEIHWHLIQANF